MTKSTLHLASSSQRRVEILTALGLTFTSQGVDIDETPFDGEDVRDMVLRLAEDKARAAADLNHDVVLGSDTAVALDGVIFGKPAGQQEAMEMLARLSGRSHEVLTGVVVIAGGKVLRDLSVTSVHFREIQADEARQYWQSGEPVGKAGAYAIQGLGGIFVESMSGSYSGVVGLPVFQTAELLRQVGVTVMDAKLTEGGPAE